MKTCLISDIRIPIWKIFAVLIGFPIVSTVISLMLLNRDLFSSFELDFFSAFWTIITCWYLIQIVFVYKVLKASGLNLINIGYSFDKRKTLFFVLGYLIAAFVLFGFVEYALSSVNITLEQINELSDFSNLTPKTTVQRVIFIFAGLVAGISEEFVYRGFAINAIESHKVNKWMAVILATVPFVFQHGLKSVDQFWWFFISGLVMSVIYLLINRRLYINIILHWIVILSAILAILQVIE